MPADGPKRAVPLLSKALMPIVGFGTWQIEGNAAFAAVSAALELGYRHLDTATVYDNEAEVGRALASSAIARDELFITTKVPPSTNDPRATLEASLRALRSEYVDLWLIHWPPNRSGSLRLWEEMCRLKSEGKARAIGVSNYSIEEIDVLEKASGSMPEVNQIPWSPFLYDADLESELSRRHVVLEGYSPFKTSRLDEASLQEIARTHSVSAAQVVLAWHVQHEVVVIPKSVHRARIAENLDIFGFSLSPDEMARLDALARRR